MKENVLNNRRVVVTGLGVVSSIGIGWQEFWKNLIAGKSGISKVTSFDTSEYDRHYAGEVKDFSVEKILPSNSLNQVGRTSQFTIVAARLALEDARIELNKFVAGKTGVCIGTTMGEPQVVERLDEQYFPKGNPLAVDQDSALSYPANLLANHLSGYFNLSGPAIVYSTACAAGNYAIARSYDLIRSGKCDFMLAGGSDALSRIAFTGFSRLFAMAPEICQPFDKNRKGILIGEGAGILFLESLESALRRKVNIYAEVTGYGMSCDAQHMTNPSVEGICKAITKSFKNSGVNAHDIDYVCAHGTGTRENDRAESQAIHRVFNSRGPQIPVSSIKSMIGHTMGAAAALESVACCLVIKNGEIPPTINFHEKDSECDINCVPNKSLKRNINIAVNNSQAFGGNNACVVFQK